MDGRRLIRAALCWAVVTLAWCALVIALSAKLRAQQFGCYQIDRFGELCVPSTGEIFVDLVHDEYAWINDGNYKAADGTHCCGMGDCVEVKPGDLVEAPGGLSTPFGGIDARGVYQSRDGKAWVC